MEHRGAHWCGGTLVFTRSADGISRERCDRGKWAYAFDAPSAYFLAGVQAS